MNNKGQVLIVFILLLPLFLMLMVFITDIGLLYTESKKIENNVKEAIEYGLTTNDSEVKENIDKLLYSNIDNIKSSKVTIENNIITISITKDKKTVFNLFFKNNEIPISITYKGYIDNNKITYEKE